MRKFKAVILATLALHALFFVIVETVKSAAVSRTFYAIIAAVWLVVIVQHWWYAYGQF